MNIDEVKPYPNNAKEHTDEQIEMIARSLKRWGWRSNIMVNKDGIIIAGHGRYLAYKKYPNEIKTPWIVNELGETIFGGPETKPFESIEDEKAYRLADNQLNAVTGVDMTKVKSELNDLSLKGFDFTITGFDNDLIIRSDRQDDVIPTKPTEVKSKIGDMYILGNHKVICGDSLLNETLDKLFDGGEKAKVVFTSPPYNINSGMYKTYKDNLPSEEYVDFNINIIQNCLRHLKGFIFWNISYNKNSRTEFIQILYKIIKETGLKFLELIVWNKKHAMPITSRELLTRQYEDVFVLSDENSMQDMELFSVGSNTKAYFNKKTNKGITNYWEIGTNNTQLDNHGACFPVELPVRGIVMMSDPQEIILDPFLGSGSTLIACEKTQRVCYGVEFDPAYVDVIIERWCRYTGIYKIIKNGQEIIWQEKQDQNQTETQ